MTLDEYWRDLVTAALLGTDRRDPPDPPPGLLADLVDDAVRPDGASRMLAAVAGVAAARRAAFVPGPPAASLQPPDVDDRPWCSAAAVRTWRAVVADWPVLEDEWVSTVVQQGLRVPPDAVVELLQRHRSDVVRRARAALAVGPSARWLVEHLPGLGVTGSASGTASAEAVASLPDLAVPPELIELLSADSHMFVSRLLPGFDADVYGRPHRAVLVNLIARCRPAVLLDAAKALDATHVGLAFELADLAKLRHRMLVELGLTP